MTPDTKSAENWNADYWHLFLCQHCDNRATSPNGMNTVALKIADTMDALRGQQPLSGGRKETWQPIETAPKDGTEVLGWWSGSKTHTIVSWSGDGWWKDSADGGAINAPTHWQHLQDGPAFSSTECGGGK